MALCCTGSTHTEELLVHEEIINEAPLICDQLSRERLHDFICIYFCQNYMLFWNFIKFPTLMTLLACASASGLLSVMVPVLPVPSSSFNTQGTEINGICPPLNTVLAGKTGRPFFPCIHPSATQGIKHWATGLSPAGPQKTNNWAFRLPVTTLIDFYCTCM